VIAGSPLGRAAAHLCLALALHQASRHGRSIAHNRRALRYARAAGSMAAEGNALTMLAMAYVNVGRLIESEGVYLAAIEINRQLNLRPGISAGLGNLATVYIRLGRLQSALACVTETIEICAADKLLYNEAMVTVTLGEVTRRMGRYEEAEKHLLRAIELSDQTGHSGAKEIALRNLGRVMVDDQRPAQALTIGHEALNMAESSHWVGAAASSYSLIGRAHNGLGEHQVAIECHTYAIDQARRLGEMLTEFDSLCGLAVVHADRKDYPVAMTHALAAIELARRHKVGPLQAQAELTAAEVMHRAGDADGAAQHARRSLDLYECTDDELPKARCRVLLGE